MNEQHVVLTGSTLQCEMVGTLHVHVEGEQPSSRLRGMWAAFRRKSLARPFYVTNSTFHSAAYMPRWRDRIAAAWNCLRGYGPTDAPALQIHHNGDES